MKMKKIALLALLAFSASTVFASTPFVASVKDNGKWGAIDEKGQVIIPISYDNIGITLTSEAERTKDLSSSDHRNQWIEVRQGKKRGFYNREGKVIVPVSYSSRSSWTEDAIAVKVDGKVLFYNKDGKRLGTSYDEASDFKNDMAIVKVKGQYGFLSKDGSEVGPAFSEVRYFESGLAPVKEGNLWGIIDPSGNKVISPTYKNVGPHYSEGLLAVQNKQNLWGFIDKEGNTIIPFDYIDVRPLFQNGYTAVQDESKLWGFVQSDGMVTAKPQFKQVLSPFSEGLAAVSTVDGKGYAKPDGSIAFFADYDFLYPFHDGIAEIGKGEVRGEVVSSSIPISIGIGWGYGGWHHRHGAGWGIGIGFPVWGDPWYDNYATVPTMNMKRGYIDTMGRIIASPTNTMVFKANDYGILIYNNDAYGFVNKKGTFIAHTEYKKLIPVEGEAVLIAMNQNKKFGLLSMIEDKTLLSFSYEDIRYLGSGLFAYKTKEGYGLVNKEGEILTPPSYKEILNAGDGIVPAKDKTGWKLLDLTGKEIQKLDPKISSVTSYEGNRAGYKKDGKWGILDEKGNPITAPTYDNLQVL